MAAMTTSLTEFSDKENSRTYTLPTTTAAKPHKVVQTRKVPSGNQVTIEDKIFVTYTTVDSSGAILPQKVSFTTIVARPLGHDTADVTAALAVYRDIIAGDEFANTVSTQEFLV